MAKQKVLITGAKGMLGRTLVETLADDYDVLATDKDSADVTNRQAFREVAAKERPDVIIHCAAMTDVDGCEAHPQEAYLVNVKGTETVAQAAQELGCRLIYVSTDYVFSGKRGDYKESDKAGDAQTIYGQTKWQGEVAVRKICSDYIIARVSWLYGPGGPSFVHSMLKLAEIDQPTIKVVDDQIGNPTSTYAVSSKIKELLSHPQLTGVFHISCEGAASRFDFAKKIFELMGIEKRIVACSSDEYPKLAKRPHNTSLQKQRISDEGLTPMPLWQDSLALFLKNSHST